jgi:Cytochrome c7 and related cytochrome c/Class III cytochrome C family
MAQIFHPSMNTVARATIFGAVVIAAIAGYVGTIIDRSPYQTDAGVARQQPVPFSHEHHVRGLGIDCRFCHTTVEKSHFAGLPPTKTCMTCHSKIWTDAPMLEPIRASWRENRPLSWTRVHILPDFVYFNHSIHVNKGVGCATCHGPVDHMPLMYQFNSLQMEWCLNCHKNPEKYLRPPSEVFNMDYQPPPNQEEMGLKQVADEHIQKAQLTNCYICHR